MIIIASFSRCKPAYLTGSKDLAFHNSVSQSYEKNKGFNFYFHNILWEQNCLLVLRSPHVRYLWGTTEGKLFTRSYSFARLIKAQGPVVNFSLRVIPKVCIGAKVATPRLYYICKSHMRTNLSSSHISSYFQCRYKIFVLQYL